MMAVWLREGIGGSLTQPGIVMSSGLYHPYKGEILALFVYKLGSFAPLYIC